jgi:hypothetical protein
VKLLVALGLALGILLISSVALAVPGYEPLPEAARVSLRDCPASSGVWTRQTLLCGRWRIERLESDSDGLFLPDGRVSYALTRNGALKTRFEYPVQGSAAGGFDAWRGDLNGDRLEDLVIAEHSGGNGLAALIDTVSIALSSSTGYRVTTVFSFAFSPRDVMRWRGEILVVSTQFIGGVTWENGLDDGRPHSYWVSTFLRVRGSKLEVTWLPAPVWIRYTYRPNRRPESKTRVSQRQRERLWREQARSIFIR